MVYVTESDIQNLIQIARNYKATLDQCIETAKIVPYSDVSDIDAHYALYDAVKHLLEEDETIE